MYLGAVLLGTEIQEILFTPIKKSFSRLTWPINHDMNGDSDCGDIAMLVT